MTGAGSFGSAPFSFVMRFLLSCCLAGCLGAGLALPQTDSATTAKKAAPAKKTAASKGTSATKAPAATKTSAATKAPAATKSPATAAAPGSVKSTTSKTSVSRKARSTKGKSMASAAPARYRQAAPTPDRYREIQQALVDKGYLKAEPNGVWDQQSSDALKQFQTDQKQMPTGKITASSLIGLGLGPKSATTPDSVTTGASAVMPTEASTPSNAPQSVTLPAN
jgi:hypothetical protein